jgi:hypothetical protein
MIRKTGWWGMMGMTLLMSLAAGRRAMGQWSTVSFGVAEYDTRQTLLLLAGISATPKAAGLQPVLALQAYSLGFYVNGTRTNVLAVRPGAGLGYNYNGGAISGTVGYLFSNNTNTGGPVVGAERGRGVDVAGDWDYWGTGGPLGYQALGSYNFGSKSFWGRGRATTRISQSGASSTRLGAEVAYLSGPGYSAWQPGGVFEWHFPAGQILGLGAGAKLANSGGNAAYFRVEGLLPLTR